MDITICNNNFINDFNDLITNLSTISRLELNDKISKNGKLIVIDNVSYMQGIYRWWNASSRKHTIKIIKNIYLEVDKITDNLISCDCKNLDKVIIDYIDLLNQSINKSLIGLKILRKTYESDIQFCKKLNKIIEKIEKSQNK